MAIEYTPESSLVADPAEGGSFSTSNNAELAGAQSFAAKAKLSEIAAATSETNSANSATASAGSATAASGSATQSADSATASATSATQSATSATASATSATASANSATAAATSETNAGTSATTATTKASEASTSATNAATSETNAGTSATAASNSATAASTSATSASGSATTATTKASEASTSETNAGTSATASATSATASANSATAAATSATNAGTSETAAATSATNAATSATSSANSATASAGSATNSSNSATSAATAQTAAEAARDAALAAFDSFDDRYLGQKTSDPSTDNDGNALVAGTLYFNTSTDSMMVYEGSSWVAAYASLSGALIANNNLSDLNNAATARTNIGLGTNSSPAFTGLAVDTNTLIVDSTNNRVGIKRGTPTAELDVNGTIKAVDLDVTGGESYLCRTHSTTNASLSVLRMCAKSTGDMQDGFGTGITFDAGDNDGTISSQVAEINAVRAGSDDIFNLELQTGDVSRLTLGTTGATIATGTSGTDRFKVDSSGNVGINTGTNSITEKLDVVGNIAVSGTVDGRDVAGDGTKLDGVEASADVTDTANVVAALSAGTGISLSNGGVVANTSPDQTVSLTGAGTTTISGTYPNFTITGAGTTYTAGTGLTLTGTEFSIGQDVATTASPTFAAINVNGLVTSDDFQIDLGTTTASAQITTPSSLTGFNAFSIKNTHTEGYLSFGTTLGQARIKATGANGSADPLDIDVGGITAIGIADDGAVTMGGDVTLDAGLTGDAILTIRSDSDNNAEGDHPSIRFKQDGDLVDWRIGIGSTDADGGTNNNDLCFSHLAGSSNGLKYVSSGGTVNTIWHAGNDGAGSGLDADTVDGLGTATGEGNNTIAVRTASGYLHAQYFNGTGTFSTSGASSGMARFTGTNGSDTYGRSYSAAAAGLLIGQSGGMSDIRTDLVVHGSYRDHGMFGTYVSTKTAQIWSMGTAYRNHASGTNFGNLYGLAYKHTNNSTGGTMASGHQMVWCQNGSPKAAMGTNIWTSGNVTAYSDIRVKTNIEHIPNALDKVCQLNGYTFDRTDVTFDDHGEPETPIRQTGVIAQEVLKVLPEAVMGDEDGHYSVAYGNMVGLLIESIKELKAEVDDLKAELDRR